MYRVLLSAVLALLAFTIGHAQPANDSCGSAVALTLDVPVDFTTVDATTDGPDHPDCFSDEEGTPSVPLDVWFTYTPMENVPLRFSNCLTADYDSRVAVYAVADPCLASADNLVDCNDDGPDCENFASQIDWIATADQPYVIRLGGFPGVDGITSGSGTATLSIIENIPANDICANATTVSLGVDQDFVTTNAFTDGPDHPDNPCFGFGSITAGADVWYEYTPDFTGFVEWSTCNTATFDTRLAVYDPGSACPPTDTDLYACNDDGGGCADFSSNLVFGVVAGQTYKLRLGGFGGESGTGTFNLLQVTPPDPPANDLCANAIPVNLITPEQADALDSLTIGTTISATFQSEGYQFPVCLGNQSGGEFADVWYVFQTFGNTEIKAEILPAGDGGANLFYLDIFSDCDNRVDTTMIGGSCVTTDEEFGLGETTITGLPEGENITLYVRITTRLTTEVPGEFGFQLSADLVSEVEEVAPLEALEFFPNPADEQATIRYRLTESTTVAAQIFDLMGRRVQSRDLGRQSEGDQSFTFDVRALAAGVYTLRLGNGQAATSLRFVVK